MLALNALAQHDGRCASGSRQNTRRRAIRNEVACAVKSCLVHPDTNGMGNFFPETSGAEHKHLPEFWFAPDAHAFALVPEPICVARALGALWAA